MNITITSVYKLFCKCITQGLSRPFPNNTLFSKHHAHTAHSYKHLYYMCI